METKQNEYYYYDYVVEEAGNGIMMYDPLKDEWNVTNSVLPSARQGSCALVVKGKIILIGGKGHQEEVHGSDKVWEFDPETKEWNKDQRWASMKRQRYYHACTLGMFNDEKGIFVVGGRGDEYNQGNTAEFLPLETFKGPSKWLELPFLRKPHPNMPAANFMDGKLFVLGGGGFPFPGGENTVEIFDGVKWSSFTSLKPERTFASSIKVPSKWFSTCEMEPNLGIHKYHQKKTVEMLKGKQWLCMGEHLKMSEQDEAVMIGGCTVPGCHYPHFFSHHVNSSTIRSLRVRGGRLSCQHADEGTPANRIECRLTCKKGWRNVQSVGVTICTRGQAEALAKINSLADKDIPLQNKPLRKTTNFTTDYLECRRESTRSVGDAEVTSQKNSIPTPTTKLNNNNVPAPTLPIDYDPEMTTFSSNDDDAKIVTLPQMLTADHVLKKTTLSNPDIEVLFK